MNEYMKIAKELSEDNLKTKNGGPFGAVIVKDNQIISKAYNKKEKTIKNINLEIEKVEKDKGEQILEKVFPKEILDIKESINEIK